MLLVYNEMVIVEIFFNDLEMIYLLNVCLVYSIK